MGCLRVKLRDLGRYQKKYPLIRNEPKTQLISDSTIEIETRIISITNSDSINVVFEKPFSAAPNVVAGFVDISFSGVGNVNVYTSDITTAGCTIRTSAVITGQISLQAMYIP
jgi:hypothetical protein